MSGCYGGEGGTCTDVLGGDGCLFTFIILLQMASYDQIFDANGCLIVGTT